MATLSTIGLSINTDSGYSNASNGSCLTPSDWLRQPAPTSDGPIQRRWLWIQLNAENELIGVNPISAEGRGFASSDSPDGHRVTARLTDDSRLGRPDQGGCGPIGGISILVRRTGRGMPWRVGPPDRKIDVQVAAFALSRCTRLKAYKPL